MNESIRIDEYTQRTLMDEAERLAIQAFGDYAEAEHIEAVYERLVWCWQRGMGDAGAVTIH